jgi:hypothetical protein
VELRDDGDVPLRLDRSEGGALSGESGPDDHDVVTVH